MIHQALPSSSIAALGHHYAYDSAGNIGSKQVETSTTGSAMTTYTHNRSNQITAIGGSSGVETIRLRGTTHEPATVKVKPSIASVWKDARMLSENRFEADLSLNTGANQINIQAKDGSNNVSNYTYALNLASASAATPAYDADGNLLSDGVRGYQWDSQSRLVKITWGGSPVKSTAYRYNALGQRCEQIELTGTTETAHFYYLYDGIHYLCRYTGGTAATNIDRQYFSQGEQRKNGAAWNSYYYTRDHLGSIREVMNSDGSLAARYDYDPYGKRQTQYQAATYPGGCDFGYTGHITQQSAVGGQGEIVLTLFRAYDPDLGRWPSRDPIGERGGLNLYGFVGNNGVSKIDFLGLNRLEIFGDGPQVDQRGFFFGFGIKKEDECYHYRISSVTFNPTVPGAVIQKTGAFLGGKAAEYDARQITIRSPQPKPDGSVEYKPSVFIVVIETEKDRKWRMGGWEKHTTYRPRIDIGNMTFQPGSIPVDPNLHNIANPNPAPPFDVGSVPSPSAP